MSVDRCWSLWNPRPLKTSCFIIFSGKYFQFLLSPVSEAPNRNSTAYSQSQKRPETHTLPLNFMVLTCSCTRILQLFYQSSLITVSVNHKNKYSCNKPKLQQFNFSPNAVRAADCFCLLCPSVKMVVMMMMMSSLYQRPFLEPQNLVLTHSF